MSMFLTSKVTNFGLIAGETYRVSYTDLNCVRVTLPNGFKTTVALVHFFH